MKKVTILILFSIILVSGVCAEMKISEIMYDPSGTETKKEWIEIYNNGEDPINISGWKIDDGTPRIINLYRGSYIIENKSFAIVTRDGENFSSEYPFYTGAIFTSTFQLSNSGKEVYIFDQENQLIDFVNYTDIALEDYTIEINGSEKENTNMNNWIQGILKGNPGNIIEYTDLEIPPVINESINETIPPTENNQSEVNNQTSDEDNENNHASVPEFDYLGTILALIGVGVIFIVGRNR
jgi:hypothetical protein